MGKWKFPSDEKEYLNLGKNFGLMAKGVKEKEMILEVEEAMEGEVMEQEKKNEVRVKIREIMKKAKIKEDNLSQRERGLDLIGLKLGRTYRLCLQIKEEQLL